MYLLGVEIGGTKLQLALGREPSRIEHRLRFKVDSARGGQGIREQIAQGIAQWRAQFKISAVGIGFGGPVDARTGKICCSHQVQGWDDFEIGAWAKELADAPVLVDNDANVGALGEAIHGAGRGMNPVFYITMGSGVGGGLVVDGSIYHGALPGEAEVGHLRLDRSGTIVESRCSGWAVDGRIREALIHHAEGQLAQMVSASPGNEARHLRPALEANDPLAAKLLAELCEDAAFALSHVTHLFHPEVIVLSGGLSLIGEPLRAGIAAKLPDFVMHALHPAPAIKLAGLGEDAIPVGALELARSALR